VRAYQLRVLSAAYSRVYVPRAKYDRVGMGTWLNWLVLLPVEDSDFQLIYYQGMPLLWGKSYLSIVVRLKHIGLAGSLSGISVGQMAFYLNAFDNDRRSIKLVVSTHPAMMMCCRSWLIGLHCR